ncbi:MAG: VCBS repeat-containing protein, partial [Chloroflexi bacterium]|nr:VCBS repeat-containing protein [Chloroflexota bacterium]
MNRHNDGILDARQIAVYTGAAVDRISLRDSRQRQTTYELYVHRSPSDSRLSHPMISWLVPLNTAIRKNRAAGLVLLAAAAGGPITFWGLAGVLPRRASATLVAATWGLAIVGGFVILGCDPPMDADEGLRSPVTVPRPADMEPVTPFTDVAAVALKEGFHVWNDRPGVAIFDYDRDGDLDFYITAEGGHANRLYRNGGNGIFEDVAFDAGVTAIGSHSTGAVACDFDNDGYQDLYVGAWGDPKDRLDFRSPSDGQGNRDVLFLNNGDGTFTDITDSAFGDSVNVRSATSIACGDVNRDGWLDIYVGNLAAQDFRTLASPNHPGHYNVLYINNGDLTFAEVAETAGVRGPQAVMRDPEGRPIVFEDPITGDKYEGYDPTERDALG